MAVNCNFQRIWLVICCCLNANLLNCTLMNIINVRSLSSQTFPFRECSFNIGGGGGSKSLEMRIVFIDPPPLAVNFR